MVGRIHIIVVEPSAIIRCGVVTLLQRVAHPNIDIAEFADVSMLLSQKQRSTSDILIINPSYLGNLSLSQLRQELCNDCLKVVALQGVMLSQGVIQNFDDVITIYDSVEVIANKIVSIISSDAETSVRKELSQREREIIVCVVKGMTNKQIADELILSTHTIIAHRRNIANKLQIHSPSGLTIYAIVNKLVDLSDIHNVITQKKEE